MFEWAEPGGFIDQKGNVTINLEKVRKGARKEIDLFFWC